MDQQSVQLKQFADKFCCASLYCSCKMGMNAFELHTLIHICHLNVVNNNGVHT